MPLLWRARQEWMLRCAGEGNVCGGERVKMRWSNHSKSPVWNFIRNPIHYRQPCPSSLRGRWEILAGSCLVENTVREASQKM